MQVVTFALAGALLKRPRTAVSVQSAPVPAPSAASGSLITIPFFVGAPDSQPIQAAVTHAVYVPFVGGGNGGD